jgi:hypothetical protein
MSHTNSHQPPSPYSPKPSGTHPQQPYGASVPQNIPPKQANSSGSPNAQDEFDPNSVGSASQRTSSYADDDYEEQQQTRPTRQSPGYDENEQSQKPKRSFTDNLLMGAAAIGGAMLFLVTFPASMGLLALGAMGYGAYKIGKKVSNLFSEKGSYDVDNNTSNHNSSNTRTQSRSQERDVSYDIPQTTKGMVDGRMEEAERYMQKAEDIRSASDARRMRHNRAGTGTQAEHPDALAQITHSKPRQTSFGRS